MKQLFHIQNSNTDNGQQVLSLRLGEKHASFAITNRSGTELYSLGYCRTENWGEKELSVFLETYPSLKHSFYEIFVAYDFPQSVWVPSKEFKQDDAAFLLQVSGKSSGRTHTISELISEWQLCNVYAVPKEVHEWLAQQFPAAKCWHQFSLDIRNMNAAGNIGSLAVDFRNEDFSVMVTGNGKLLLTRTFDYTTPEDVLYHLLKICTEFRLSQKEVLLQLSGLIEKQSALYKELYQYFIHIDFRESSWNTGQDHPPHFFTSLNDLARCAS